MVLHASRQQREFLVVQRRLILKGAEQNLRFEFHDEVQAKFHMQRAHGFFLRNPLRTVLRPFLGEHIQEITVELYVGTELYIGTNAADTGGQKSHGHIQLDADTHAHNAHHIKLEAKTLIQQIHLAAA